MGSFRRCFLLLAVIATICLPATVCREVPEHSQQQTGNASENKLDSKLLREDFQVMRKALEEGDSGIYRYVPKQQMDEIFEEAYTRIDHPMDVMEFYRIVAPVVGAIKCGHTRILPPFPILAAVGLLPPGFPGHADFHVSLFPAEVAILDRHVYVAEDFATTDKQLIGAEILSINGTPIKQILQTMEAVFHGDGNISTAGPWRLSHDMTFSTALYLLLGMQPPFHVDYRSLHSQITVKIVLEGKTLSERAKLSPQHEATPPVTELKFLDNDKIATLKISTFGRAMTQELLQNSFEQIHSHGSSTLILDLRGNHGGQDELGRILFSYLTAEPFPYYKDLIMSPGAVDYLEKPGQQEVSSEFEKGIDGKLHWVKHPNWGMQQPTQPVFTGKVFVLMDGGSFSTTCEFLSTLHFHHRAVFIGEESGGDYYGNTSGIDATVPLPHSGLVLDLNMVSYYLAVGGYPYPDHGVMPDYPVKYSIEERLARTDKDMALALELARHPGEKTKSLGHDNTITP